MRRLLRAVTRKWSQIVDAVAKLLALAVLAIGIATVWTHSNDTGDDPDRPPTSTTTVAQVTGRVGDRPKVTTTIVKKGGTEQRTTVVAGAGQQTQETTTVAARDQSLLERALGSAGLIVFRLALVLVAAFLTGAIVQRALLGKFAIKLPFVEIADLPAAAAASTEAITTVHQGLMKQIDALAEKVDQRFASGSTVMQETLSLLIDVSQTVRGLEERVAQLERGNTP